VTLDPLAVVPMVDTNPPARFLRAGRIVEPSYEPVEPAWPDEPAIGGRQRTALELNGGKVLRTMGLEELEKAEPNPPPMLGIIPKVGLTVIAGPPKIGKSLLASQMALCVGEVPPDEQNAPAPMFLGHDLSQELGDQIGAALLVMEEGSLAGISYRIRHQRVSLGIEDAVVNVAHRQRIRLDEKASRVALRDWVATWKPSLVVLDPLNRLHGADENRPTQMTPVMDAMAGIAYEFGCAVLAVHHLAKPSAERRGDIWDRFRGASSIRSGTDANLAMDGAGARVELVGEYRDAEPLHQYLELDRESVSFTLAEAPTLPGKVDRDELDAFLSPLKQVSVRQVALHFKTSKNTAQTALDVLGLDTYDGPRGTRFYVTGTAQ
jgi:hypothetical protein